MNSVGTTNKTFVMLNCLVIIALMTFGSTPVSVYADNGTIPVDLQAKLFLTALTYDKNLEQRAASQLDIGIIYFPTSAQSKEEALTFAKTLERFKDKKISGHSFRTVLFTYNGKESLKQKIIVDHIDVLYIAQGEKQLLEEVLTVTRSEKVLSCTSKAEYVSTCGVSMAVGLKDSKPKIYLNLISAKREGADFSAKFLRVVEIVEKK